MPRAGNRGDQRAVQTQRLGNRARYDDQRQPG
jgi:hypothetical protein